MTAALRVALVLAVALPGCRRAPAAPAPLDTRNDACALCRMRVSDPQFAAQLVAPGEEPRFFDDIGCLRDWLRAHPQLPRGAIAWVADHRTRAWGRAAAALYVRVPGVATPMGSHLIAHESAMSAASDPAAAGGTTVPAVDIFGPGGPPDGAP